MTDTPAIPPEAVATLGAHFGVPPDAIPVLVRLDVQPEHGAAGWVATTTDVRRVHLAPSPDWPAGQLDVVGALVEEDPEGRDRPFLNLEGIAAVSAYAAQLHIPSGRAAHVPDRVGRRGLDRREPSRRLGRRALARATARAPGLGVRRAREIPGATTAIRFFLPY